VNHSEVAVCVPVMDEMQFLFLSEPRKSLKPRPLYMIFFVEKDMRVERDCTCNHHHCKKCERQYEVGASAGEKHWDKEERRIVALVTKVRSRDKMASRIIGVMKVDVVMKEPPAHSVVT
jgi:hypothetical protein